MNKLILIGIGIAALGLIALPQTLALFAGQHDFYEVSRDPANLGVPCVKCHADVASELFGSQVHSQVLCESCHVMALTNKGAKIGGDQSIHAAAAPACLDCHDGRLHGGNETWHSFAKRPLVCLECHDPVDVSTNFINATSILYGANESHTEFASNASSATLLKGANEACIGCHTHVIVNITWQKPTNLSFKASVSTQGVWNVTDFAAGGVKTTNTTGNATGNGSIVP
jgi:hypothetical protein